MAFILTQEGYLQVLYTDLSISDLATKDHDLLDGLTDDDHTQYILAAASRAMTADWPFGNYALFIGDDANTKQTIGLTINQGTNDDEIVSLKSSDVAHGMTTWTETDTFADFKKANPSTGGLLIRGWNGGSLGIQLLGLVTTEDTSKNSESGAAIILDSGLKSGTTLTHPGAGANIVGIREYGTTIWIIDKEGDTWQAGGGTFGGRCIGSLSETIPEVVQQDAEPGTTYPGLIWVDTDASPASSSVLSDADGDTKIQCEESADEDKIRFDCAGSEMGVWDAVGLTQTIQPAFCVGLSSAVTNFAKDAWRDIEFDAETFDQGGDFDTDTYTFTAPMDGTYVLCIHIRMDNMDTACLYYGLKMTTSNETYQWTITPKYNTDPAYASFGFAIVTEMDASDTVKCTLYQPGGTNQMDMPAGRAANQFSGWMLG
jgi:hypothetical protein